MDDNVSFFYLTLLIFSIFSFFSNYLFFNLCKGEALCVFSLMLNVVDGLMLFNNMVNVVTMLSFKFPTHSQVGADQACRQASQGPYLKNMYGKIM